MTLTLEQTQPHLDWHWQDWCVHYVHQGQQGPPLLLIHGFGASTDHWRKNIEVLSQSYRVWAIDLLGFGRSQKPSLTYTSELWCGQLQSFCEQVVQEPVFVVGNSLGGAVALNFAVDCPQWCRGVVLLNCAGRFSDQTPTDPPQGRNLLATWRRQFFRSPALIAVISFGLFHYMRRRSQIRKVLLQIYKDPAAVTDRLVEEIYQPALDRGALEVFSAVFKAPPSRTLDQLLEALQHPLLLLWGEADPWITPGKATQFCQHYPAAELQLLDAGHCPHDERPDLVNAAIDQWVQKNV